MSAENENINGEVITFNLYDLSWDEIVEKGMERYVDKDAYEKYQQRLEAEVEAEVE